MEDLTIICFLVQTACLGKFRFTSYRPKIFLTDRFQAINVLFSNQIAGLFSYQYLWKETVNVIDFLHWFFWAKMLLNRTNSYILSHVAQSNVSWYHWNISKDISCTFTFYSAASRVLFGHLTPVLFFSRSIFRTVSNI